MSGLLHDVVQGLRGVPPGVAVLIIGALPVTEARGAVIAGINFFHLPALQVLALSVAGNFLSITPLALFLEPLEQALRRNRLTARLLHWAFARAERNAARVQRWGPLGLFLFVAIPLPGTGAWTGTLIALLLGLRRLPTFVSLYGGIIVAGTVMTVIATAAGVAVRRLFVL